MFAFKDTIRNHIINNQIFDIKIYQIAKKYIKKNTIVIDAGANFGQMSILFLHDPSIKVYAFVYKFIYKILCKNIEANKCNVKPFNCVLGNSTEKKIYLTKSKLKLNSTYGSNEIVIGQKKQIVKK